MNSSRLKVTVSVFFTCLTILLGAARSFAQDDSATDEKAREDQAQQALNQIHDLESKMEDNGKRLDALEKAVNQTEEANSGQTAPIEQAPAQAIEATIPIVVPVEEVSHRAATPVQVASAGTDSEDRFNEHKVESGEVLSTAPIYYAPLTSFPKEHTFEISEEDFYSNLKEEGNNRKGPYFGINLAYTFRPLEAESWPVNVYHLDMNGDYGILNYNDGLGDKVKNIRNYIIEPRAWVGKDFDFSPMVKLTPYMGVGYRWNYEETKNKMVIDFFDDSGDTLEIKPNNKQTQYVYIPVGGILSVHPAEGWRVDLNAEYDYLAWGRVTFYSPQTTFNGIPLTTQSTNNTLKHGFGLRGSIKFVKEEDVVNYFVEPYICYWHIGTSRDASLIADGFDTGIRTQEQKNQSTEIGARLGIEF